MDRTVEALRVSRAEIKICGITDVSQAVSCVANGVEAIGLMFVAASPRHVEEQTAREIVAALCGRTVAVGVFMNASVGDVLRICEATGVSAVQLHGGETPGDVDFLREKGLRVIKRLKSRGEELLRDARRYAGAHAFLVECGSTALGGGEGVAWNWNEAALLQGLKTPFALAGGLSPTNVAFALDTSGADAVDVSSGVETAPGKKSPKRIEAFVKAVGAVEKGDGLFRRVFGSGNAVFSSGKDRQDNG